MILELTYSDQHCPRRPNSDELRLNPNGLCHDQRSHRARGHHTGVVVNACAHTQGDGSFTVGGGLQAREAQKGTAGLIGASYLKLLPEHMRGNSAHLARQ